jgi:hypothetical protein
MKTFEQYNNEPKVGDYVICICKPDNTKLIKFLSNNIGQIDYITKNKDVYSVKFENMTKELKYDFGQNKIGFKRSEILHHSTNKEDLEILIQATKFNL